MATLQLRHGFHQAKWGDRFTISETARREVLDRLLELTIGSGKINIVIQHYKYTFDCLKLVEYSTQSR